MKNKIANEIVNEFFDASPKYRTKRRLMALIASELRFVDMRHVKHTINEILLFLVVQIVKVTYVIVESYKILSSKRFWRDFFEYYSSKEIAKRINKFAKELEK